MASTVAYALVLGIGGKATAGASVVTMLRAEGAKILVIFAGLWWAMTRYSGHPAVVDVRDIRGDGVAVPRGLSRARLIGAAQAATVW